MKNKEAKGEKQGEFTDNCDETILYNSVDFNQNLFEVLEEVGVGYWENRLMTSWYISREHDA